MIKAVSIGLASLVVVSLVGLSGTGFCFSERRYVPDEEPLQAIVAALVNEADTARLTGVNTASDFFRKFPHCCHVSEKSDASSLFLRVFGGAKSEVSIRYTFVEEGKERDRVFIIDVDCCGQSLSRISG